MTVVSVLTAASDGRCSDASLQFWRIFFGPARASCSIDAVLRGRQRSKNSAGADAAGVIGIGLGVLLSTLLFAVIPGRVKLGLAGGPLIMALILGRIISIGVLYWFMPPSANPRCVS